ncbi:MAG: hypothetical protein MUD14_11310 [Hydrococcus sp. Prado102]|jgi:hypothetical protein|nr:hypothetical protein [Hydrococcus sp. Prado102]
MNQLALRQQVLTTYGASSFEIEELLAYNHNIFDRSSLKLPIQFPLPSEPHITAWEGYAAEARQVGAFEALKRVLVQFRFPIEEGISETENYRAATRKGVSLENISEATGLVLHKPEKLQLFVHESLAGAIPVLQTPHREDFVTLVRALTMRNEPKPVPAAMGACIVSGFNNWDRIRQYRRQWETVNPSNISEASWLEEFGRLLPQKQLYQDRFIILSGGSYSNVCASDMKLDELEWRRLSLTIRLEHECTHYFTRRLFGSMRNNLLDELIADYRGIVAAVGCYRADWFLRFLGLESFPDYREGGRLQNYRGQPSLSDRAFKILQALVKDAAENLQRCERELESLSGQPLMLIALTCLTLEELASPEGHLHVQKTLDRLQKMLCIC